jgi:hypothetical protein
MKKPFEQLADGATDGPRSHAGDPGVPPPSTGSGFGADRRKLTSKATTLPPPGYPAELAAAEQSAPPAERE